MGKEGRQRKALISRGWYLLLALAVTTMIGVSTVERPWSYVVDSRLGNSGHVLTEREIMQQKVAIETGKFLEDDDDWYERLREEMKEVDESKLSLEGNCDSFRHAKEKKYLFVTGYGEQAISSLQGIMNGIVTSAKVQRAHVGPFIRRTHNAVSSVSTTRTRKEHVREGPAPDFISNYLNLTFVQQTENLCLVTTALLPEDVCDGQEVDLCVGVGCGPDNCRAYQGGKQLRIKKYPDLGAIITKNKELLNAKCIVVSKLNKVVAHTMKDRYHEVYPCPPLSQFGSGTPEVSCAKDMATRWLFEPAKRPQVLAERVRRKTGLVDHAYIGLHVRMEKLHGYGCKRKRCSCSFLDVLDQVIDTMPDIKAHLEIPELPENERVYIAADIGRSASYMQTEEFDEEKVQLFTRMEEAFPSHVLYTSMDRPMMTYVDILNLAYAKHCISFGAGNVSKSVSYIRLRMGKDPCLLITDLTDEDETKCTMSRTYQFRGYRGKSFGYKFGHLNLEDGLSPKFDRSQWPQPPNVTDAEG